MKLQFPCKEHDFEHDGNVRCYPAMEASLAKNREEKIKFNCPNIGHCMLLVERELCDVMNAPKKILTNQEDIKQELVRELELEPEFAEAV